MYEGESETRKTCIRILRSDDIEQAYMLETEGYPADEAASYEQLVYRQREAPQLFLGYFEGSKLIGYVCCTKYPGPHLTEQSMKVHDPSADSVCIHSVCVAGDKRRQGVALKTLTCLVQHVRKTQNGIHRILLICKAYLIPLYTRAGFTLVGESNVIHGKFCCHNITY
ncbi:hypothetical protein NP493_166g03031 [Ridgeia piscesae]|uniref:Serotonin N-acetyltransferase n=1 Tax=Ridgeia piscesae TaxID=27915 RepID=A0AAD9UFJ7_RIDPI|nr:hypothetical protein NP493_166g03031 [Ridgeia piscesae]